ncbi:hypothetical protein Y032_0459g1840 [Ancylostoma ceylanicum]|uniref:Major facilitator superfamily (MFS) profile domain-containing protein n=1 Tax=Ancylostoma ceylanicum TaxID=53326 RepID=A0A016WXY6_9BILA|nr:hypothetical protein Y032_0459g1840 [Ancylostoma ceylanicum]
MWFRDTGRSQTCACEEHRAIARCDLVTVWWNERRVARRINTGVFYAVSTLLAQMVLPFYPTESEAIGQIGVAIVVAGMLGSVVGGFLLDRFKKFKLTTVLDYLFSFLAMLAFTFTLDLGSIVVVFVNAFILGFFMTGYLPIGFEFAAEITFPAAEGTTGGLLNASAQIFGMLLTLAMGQVMHGISTFWCNIIMSAALIFGTFLTTYLNLLDKLNLMVYKVAVKKSRNLAWGCAAIERFETAVDRFGEHGPFGLDRKVLEGNLRGRLLNLVYTGKNFSLLELRKFCSRN